MYNKLGDKGTLYLCATPIGNLEDITLRVLRTLKEVDMIAAEDTRHTLKLLNHFQITKPLISYHEHSSDEKGKHIVSLLCAGKDIALVSDAGTPAISDPGEDLVKLCIQNGILVIALPGAVAAITGLIVSGLSTKRFAFEGFLPANKRLRIDRLKGIADDTRTLLFYEAPHKIKKTLEDMVKTLGNRRITIARELTKKYEEVIRCSLEEAVEKYKEDSMSSNIKGEFVLVVEGANFKELQDREHDKWKDLSVEVHIDMYMNEGYDQKEAMKMVAKDRGLTKRDIYSVIIAEKE